jgi:hypothetical protein
LLETLPSYRDQERIGRRSLEPSITTMEFEIRRG